MKVSNKILIGFLSSLMILAFVLAASVTSKASTAFPRNVTLGVYDGYSRNGFKSTGPATGSFAVPIDGNPGMAFDIMWDSPYKAYLYLYLDFDDELDPSTTATAAYEVNYMNRVLSGEMHLTVDEDGDLRGSVDISSELGLDVPVYISSIDIDSDDFDGTYTDEEGVQWLCFETSRYSVMWNQASIIKVNAQYGYYIDDNTRVVFDGFESEFLDDLHEENIHSFVYDSGIRIYLPRVSFSSGDAELITYEGESWYFYGGDSFYANWVSLDDVFVDTSSDYFVDENTEVYIDGKRAWFIYREVDEWGAYYHFSVNASPRGGSEAGYYKDIEDTINLIGSASNLMRSNADPNARYIIEFESGDSLPGSIIAALSKSEKITLIYTFTYEGYVFQATITSERAKEVFNPSIPWWGPCMIANNFPTVMIGPVK